MGSYALQTVDGISLPAPAKSGGVLVGTYTASTNNLLAGATYTFSTSIKFTYGGPTTAGGSGTYSVSGSTVTLVQSGSLGGTGTATFSGGNTLTQGGGSGQAFVDRK